MKNDDLTWQEIGAQAARMGADDVADWIKAEQARREEARKAEAEAPIESPKGPIEVGKWYDVTLKRYGKVKTFRRVTLQKRSQYGSPIFVYASRTTAVYLYDAEIASITELKEVPGP